VTAPAVLAKQLSRSLGAIRALVDVSFDVPAGGGRALRGRNGAGKATAVRILTTLLRADGGSAMARRFRRLHPGRPGPDQDWRDRPERNHR